jgi:hypothetical protein
MTMKWFTQRFLRKLDCETTTGSWREGGGGVGTVHPFNLACGRVTPAVLEITVRLSCSRLPHVLLDKTRRIRVGRNRLNVPIHG